MLGVLGGLIVLIFFFQNSKDRKQSRAFYYWKTTWSDSNDLRRVIQEEKISKIYFRFFDVDQEVREAFPHPVGSLRFLDSPPQVEIVPVVFIKNRVFVRNSLPTSELARKVWLKIRAVGGAGALHFDEIQIDCDWSLATKASYFGFLENLKKIIGGKISLSATIRLHQIKYMDRAGIPPVDRGMLMFYNMGSLQTESNRNSIFNAEDAGLYASYIRRYPKPLDVVLPIFSWAIQSRGDRIVGLIEKMKAVDFSEPEVFQAEASGQFRVLEPGFRHGWYFQKEDRIRFEEVKGPDLNRAAEMLLRNSPPDGYGTVALFDLDEKNLRGFDAVFLQKIFTMFD